MQATTRMLAAAGFPGFLKRSLDEFKRLSNVAINLEGFKPPVNSLQIWDFSEHDAISQCTGMSDRDIGGYSNAKLDYIPRHASAPAHARFHGVISNQLPLDAEIERTGYAAWRTLERPRTVFGKPLWDVETYKYLALRVKSDGRKYKVNVQTESIVFSDIHQHRLYTRHAGNWETVLIKWSDFVRTNHGMIVEPQSEMMKERVRTIGIGLTDRLAGPFELCISRIWATNAIESEEPGVENAAPALVK